MTTCAIVREERPEDRAAIHRVNREAFGQVTEADVVDRLRANGKVTLSLVAEVNGQVVGHILFTPVTIGAAVGTIFVLGLAPMAVLPSYQRRGIGHRLVERALSRLRAAGHRGVVVLGHPAYYPRFGFVPAGIYGIRSEYDAPDAAFMALELIPGGLKDCAGLAKFQPEFAGV
jgi:putative acetyltransferase